MARWKRLPWDAALWGVVAVVLAAHLYLALTPANSLLNWFHFDDAFYYFKTAQNIALGHGVTFDGTGATNGFHPLWMAVCVPIFALSRWFGLLVPLRVLVVVVGVLMAATAWVMGRTGARVFGRPVGLLLAAGWALWPPLYMTTVAGGMESSLNALSLAWLWTAWAAVWPQPDDAAAVRRLGWAAAFAMLSRLDNALIVAGLGLWLLGRWWWERKVPFRRLLRLAWRFGAPGLFGVGAFLLWSRLVVGVWMPISSLVKHWWGGLDGTVYGRMAVRFRLEHAIARLLASPAAFWQRYHLWLLAALVGGVAALAAGWLLWRFARRASLPEAWTAPFRRGVVLPWALLAGGHWLYMKVLSGMLPLRDWYWLPEEMAVALVGAAFLAGAGAWAARQWPALRRAGFPVAAVLSAALAVFFLGWMGRTFPRHNDHLHPYLAQARWVEAHTPPGAVIAAPGAGALGYFVQGRRIVNMDGLISTPAYLRAWQAGKQRAYLRRLGVRYIFAGFWIKWARPYAAINPYIGTAATFRYDGEVFGLFDLN
ncbi:MAG TPA: hypothetical protein ENJ54_08475 [Chloroflexi bacterium]|nr:hypothetical protein [Chloroflexota bacterium]